MLFVDIFTFNPASENTYLIRNETGETIIIDPGCYFTAEQETLSQFIDNEKLKPLQLINTHCHPDHIFGNAFIAKKYKLELYIHALEEKVLEHAPAFSLSLLGLPVESYKGPLHFLQEGQLISIGSHSLKIILAPGHSPGSICFYSEEQNFIIGGDVLFMESIGRSDFPGGNLQQLLQSIREKFFTLPDDTIVYPGHGPSTTIGHEKKYNPYIKNEG